MSYTVNVYGESGLIWSRDRASGDGAEFQPDRGLVKVRRVSVLVSDSPDRSAEPSPLVDLSGIMGHAFRIDPRVVKAIQATDGATGWIEVSILLPDGETRQWMVETHLSANDLAEQIEARLWPEVTP